MKNYSTYKNTGIDWLGKIPNDWSVKQFKYIFIEKKSISNFKLPPGSISFGKIIYKDEDKIPESTKKGYQEVLIGEFVVNPLNLNFDLKSLRIGRSTIDVVVSQGYIILKIQNGFDPLFYEFLLRKFDVEKMKSLGHGVRQTISYTHIKNEKMVVPPVKEQKTISQFLLKKTSEIDLLISKLEKKIALLNDKKTSFIDHFVSKGIKKNCELKDIKDDYLQLIPTDWEFKKISWITSLVTQGGNPNYALGKPLHEFRVLKTKSLYDGIIKYHQSDQISLETFQNEKKSILQKGDLLVAIVGSGSIGKANVFEPEDNNNYIYSRSLGCMRFIPEINPHFVKYFFQSSYGKNLINLGIKGSTGQEVVQTSYISNLKIPIPNFEEQNSIVEIINRRLDILDELIKKEHLRKSLLVEYRHSLISSAVTGKIRITEDML